MISVDWPNSQQNCNVYVLCYVSLRYKLCKFSVADLITSRLTKVINFCKLLLRHLAQYQQC